MSEGENKMNEAGWGKERDKRKEGVEKKEKVGKKGKVMGVRI